MTRRKQERTAPTAAQNAAPPVIDATGVADFYANFAGVNVTPLDVNLLFGRAGVPLEALPGVEVSWNANVKYVARISMPVVLLPLLIQLLESQLKVARAKGILPTASPDVQAKKKAKR